MITAKPITCTIVRYTIPAPDLVRYGLITAIIELPLYLWTEFLTHRRFSRNASSARAMSPERYIGMGAYLPPVWYGVGTGMGHGEPLSDELQAELTAMWWEIHTFIANRIDRYDGIVAKEQINRFMTPWKMVRGIVTMTVDAYHYFQSLRSAAATSPPDSAMQIFARVFADAYEAATPVVSSLHLPFVDTVDRDGFVSSFATAARASYAREKGKRDDRLVASLLDGKHASPFEHAARWHEYPYPSNLTCTPNDRYTDEYELQHGWTQFRASMERVGFDNTLEVWSEAYQREQAINERKQTP